MEELSRNADLALTKQLFGTILLSLKLIRIMQLFFNFKGVTDEQNGTASGQGPSTKEEFSVYCQLLVKEIRKHQNVSDLR